MKKISITLLLLLFTTYFTMGANKQELTLHSIINGEFRPETIAGIIPMNDGEHYTQMNKEGTQIIKYSFKTGKQVETLFDVNTARECTFKSFDSYTFSPDGTKILLATNKKPIYRRSYIAEHYIYTIKRNLVEPLSDGGAQQAPVFSPDGHMIAFVRENNIFLVKMLYNNSESQITEDGEFNKILNGIPDWVYEEEFAFNSAIEFSADNTMLAFIKFDEREVPSYSFPLFAGEQPHYTPFETYPGEYTYKYPKAGEKNSIVSVHTFDIKSRVTRKMEVPLSEGGYIPRIKFTQDKDKLAIMTLNRHQNKFELYFANPRSTVCKLALRDESPYYISESIFDHIHFYPSNFSLLSERDGYTHLYWYTMGGNLVKQVTQGEFEVSNFLGWSESEDAFYYESNEESPLQKAIYKIDRRGKKTKLSNREGTNQAVFSTDLKYFLNIHSSINTPPVITLNDNTGKELTTLVDNTPLKEKLKSYKTPTKEFFTYTTSKGTQLNGIITKPADFNPNKQYPVIMYQYSGPQSQQVLNKWNLSWEDYMSSIGYLTVCVDGRGTGGRGEEFAKSTYLYLGVQEAEDQVETAKYLSKQPFVDRNNIGIWGWSFGGYTTIMSMSEGTPIFKAGVAVAPVTDWKYYDTIYGERFMRTPKENYDGYRATSAFSRADKLSGNLLIIHGMNDDNVHYQHTAEYSERLVQANKQFDMHVYTNRNHSIFGGNTRLHLFTKITNFFKQNLKDN